MDIKQLQALNIAENEVTHEFELKHPATDKGLGIFLTVISPQSDEPRRLTKSFANKVIKDETKQKRLGKSDFKFNDYEEQTINVQSACIVDWRGVTEGDKEVPFSKEKLKESILCNPLLREQIQEQLEEVENFIKA
ncbi:MAG: hypothetical protein KGV56_03380 [Gammaproteobacteria bacterium]|nr:hypothetical protein [Gammaproteobacteria bacterium]